jgi:phosphatidylinositol-3-phosphatase
VRRALLWALVAATAVALIATPALGAGDAAVPRLRHVVVVVFENRSYDQVVGNRAAPTFARLASEGALLTRYQAVTHPSLPNYVALVSGSTQGITEDCTSCSVDAPTIADTLERAGKSWKTYAEGIPRPGFTGGSSGRYAKKHVPFLYFRAIASDPRRSRRVVGFDVLGRNLAAHRLPSFALVIPDLCHDMHDCSVATGDRWLASFLPEVRPALGRDGVLFVVFDEGSYVDPSGGGGHIAAWAIGDRVKAGLRDAEPTGHYGLLRTIEDALGVPPLGRSIGAKPLSGIWQGSARRS